MSVFWISVITIGLFFWGCVYPPAFMYAVLAVVFGLLLPGPCVRLWELMLAIPNLMWPEVMSYQARHFLSGMWLTGLLFTGALLYVAATRNVVYLASALVVLLSLVAISVISVPSEQRIQHLLAEKRRTDSWLNNYIALSESLFSDILSLPYSAPSQGHVTGFEHYDTLVKVNQNFRRGFIPGYLKRDVRIAEELHQRVNFKYLDAQLARQLADAVKPLADRGDLLLTSAALNLMTAPAKTWHQMSLADDFAVAAQREPQNAGAWLGWGIARTLAFERKLTAQEKERHVNPAQQVIRAFMVAHKKHIETKSIDDLSSELRGFIYRVNSDNPALFHALYTLMARASVQIDRLNNRVLPTETVVKANAPLFRTPLKNSTDLVRNGRFIPLAGADSPYPGIAFADWPGSGAQIRWPMLESPPPTQATALVSIDASAGGEPQVVTIEQSSGVQAFDDMALYHAGWHTFPVSEQARRYLLPVTYISLPQTVRLSDIQHWMLRLARQAARHDTAGYYQSVAVVQELHRRQAAGKPDDPRVRQEWRAYETQAAREKDPARRHMLLMQGLARYSARYPDQGWLSTLSAQQQLTRWKPGNYDTLFNAVRPAFSVAISRNPQDSEAWLGWGASWLNDDPEVTVGALIHGISLMRQHPPQGSATVIWQRIQPLMLMDLLRWRIILARTITDYPEFLVDGQKNVPALPPESLLAVQEHGKRQALARQPLSPLSARESDYPHPPAPDIPADGRGRVDVERQQMFGLSDAPLPAFPQVIPDRLIGNDREIVKLAIDVGKDGRPVMVMVRSSSGVPDWDAAALVSAYRWRFTPREAPWRVEIPVVFYWRE
ncbi:energy transducer TonB family protein [Entomohabitans teleogrylli]|uniref:energy transducer TonB family protein n=1 Tax=Entomohabitans teleogrylli TaxID=1384589 RepID=UPI00073D6769|nr:energy transducer TonB [Entomohabitans teleogrylli]